MYTPRENLIHFFQNEPAQWTPFMACDVKLFRPEIIPDNVARGGVNQARPFPREQYGGIGWFGVEWGYDPAAGGSIERGRLLDHISEWEEKVVFPDLGAIDWEDCARENADYLHTDQLLNTVIYSGFFERLISFTSFEDAAMSLIDEDDQPYVHRLFDRLAGFYIEYIKHLHRHFGIESVRLHDDWGTQRGPIFSPSVHEEMIVPYIKKVVDGAHREGVLFEMHSCGMIEPLIPALISTGADTWTGQAVNDTKKLVEQYGNQFKFGVQIHMDEKPFSEDGIRRTVSEVLEAYDGKNVCFDVPKQTFTREQIELIQNMIHQKTGQHQGTAD